MALDTTPAAWIASWAEDATDVTFPLASLPETDATEADGATGDIRKVLYALCEEMYQHYNGLDSADKPAKMVISRNTSVNDTTDVITRTFALAFTMESAVGGVEVVDEA